MIRPLLLIGSVPPPYHGQAVVTEMVFQADFEGMEVERLNLAFSSSMEAVGGLNLEKFKVLWKGLTGMFSFWWRHRADNPSLYYCAGSAHWVPLIKDVLLLGSVGLLFKHRTIHYHSGGLPEWFESNVMAKFLGRIAYGGSSTSIALTDAVDVPCFRGTQRMIVPNGLDVDESFIRKDHEVSVLSEVQEITRFLYVGSLRETKGVGLIIEAAHQLQQCQPALKWRIDLVGEWASESEKTKWIGKIATYGLEQNVNFLGRLTGNDKWRAFGDADIFLFPSFYESENQPLVIIEAMGMGLPIITSKWRGIPELLDEGNTGLLVEPQDVDSLLDAMQQLIINPEKRRLMSDGARQRYTERYTKNAFLKRMSSSLLRFKS